MNESAHSIGVVSVIEPPYSVAIITKSSSAIGTEISSVVMVKTFAIRGIDAGDELVVGPHEEAQHAASRRPCTA